MDIKKFLSESRAVSPVIGVILMVAITVILAAVIGTFVLGLGDQVGDTAPQASFSFEYDGAGNVLVTHEGGDAIDNGNLNITVTGASPVEWTETDGSISAGDDETVPASPGNEVRVVWTSSNGDNSATLQKYTIKA